MQPSDFQPEQTSVTADAQRAHLVNAARLVHSWVVAQRSIWEHGHAAFTPHALAPVDAQRNTKLEAQRSTDDIPAIQAQAVAIDVPVLSDVLLAGRGQNVPFRRVLWSLGAAVAAACVIVVVIAAPRGARSLLSGHRITVPSRAVQAPAPEPKTAITTTAQPNRNVNGAQEPSRAARVDANPARTGRLEIQSDPAGAHVLLDGRDRGVTPLTVDAVPLGTHVVVLQTERGSLRKSVSVTSGGTAVVNEAIYSGWIRVLSPIEIDLRDETASIRLDERNQGLIAPGPHDLIVENRTLGFSVRRHVEIKPGETTTISVEPAPSLVTIAANRPASISIDGAPVGEAPLIDYPLSIGQHDVMITTPSGIQRHLPLVVTVTPVQLDLDLSRP